MEERLQKVMAHVGVASRRACEDLIRAGRVQVNGQVVTKLGTKVDPQRDIITVDGELLPIGAGRIYIKINKPIGVLSTASDPWGRKTVLELVNVPGRVYPVGRLDADSEGLMLLTNDGELTERLTHPRYGHAKTYLVLVRGQPDDKVLDALRQGIVLNDGVAKALEVQRLAGVSALAPGMKLTAPAGTTWLELTMIEGRKREIRRMMEKVGYPVERLIRIRLGPLELGDLQPGESRPLTPAELHRLLRVVRTPAAGRRKSKVQDKPAQPARSTASGKRPAHVAKRKERVAHTDTLRRKTKAR